MRKGVLVPLRKKYFFHPSPARIGDEEYDLSDSEDEAPSVNDEDEVPRVLETLEASESEHSEWFKVELSGFGIPGKVDDSETEEDNDSDNYYLNEPDTLDDEDELLSIPKENQTKSYAKAESNSKMETQSSDDFSVIEAPQIQGAIVGFWLYRSSQMFDPQPSGETGNGRGSQDGRRQQRNAI